MAQVKANVLVKKLIQLFIVTLPSNQSPPNIHFKIIYDI